MFDYQKFKASAYKHKYETAIEYKKSRLLYGELLEKVNTVYNSLCQMTARGTVLVLSRDIEQTVCLSLAASRAGLCCVHADERLSRDRAGELSVRYRPDTVVLPSSELARVGDVFVKGGCKSAVITGGAAQDAVFPSEFYYNDFLKMNDYTVSRPDAECCPEQFFTDGVPTALPDLSDYALRDGIYLDIPAFAPAAACALDAILQNGHKCVIAEEVSPKAFKKRRIRAVITCDPGAFDGFDCDTVIMELGEGIRRVDGGLFDGETLSRKMSEKCNRQISCEYTDGKIRSVVQLEKEDDPSAMTGSPLALALKTAATDLFYPFDADKTFAFRQKKID